MQNLLLRIIDISTCAGKHQGEIFANANSTRTTLHISKGASGNLLGFNTATKLGMLKITYQVKPDETGPQWPFNRDFESLFAGIRKVKEKSHQASHGPWHRIQVTAAPPNSLLCQRGCGDGVKAVRRTRHHRDRDRPNALGEPYCQSPQELWKESICVDMREANKAVKREKHQMLTIDDLAADLNGATFFI